MKCPRNYFYRYKLPAILRAAVGELLDQFGMLFSVDRNDMNDSDYRLRMLALIKEPPSIHLIRGSFAHLVIEELSEMMPRASGFNKNNYMQRIPELAWDLFEEIYERPGEYFGKVKPSVHEDLLELFENDEDAVQCAKDETWLQISNYIDKYLVNLQMMTAKSGDFSKSYKSCKPKFTEFEIDLENFTGFIDQVFQIGNMTVLADLKTSKLKVGKVPDADFYTPLGLSGIEADYELQLFAYLWAYHKITGKKADYLSLNYLAYGCETAIPTKYLDMEEITAMMESMVAQFMEQTESTDIEDYPMNVDGSLQILPQYDLENAFCTCNGARFAGRNWCPYDHLCNVAIGEPEPEPDFITINIANSFEVYTMPYWLCKAKGITDTELTVTVDKKSEKAMLVKYNGDESAWLPLSQLTLVE